MIKPVLLYVHAACFFQQMAFLAEINDAPTFYPCDVFFYLMLSAALPVGVI